MQKEMAGEKIILAEIARGSQQAFGILYNFYKNKVYGYALAVLHSDSAAQEIVQEVFINLWVKKETLLEVNNFGGFLRVMSRNHTLNALKKNALVEKNNNIFRLNNSAIDLATEDHIQFRETEKILGLAIEKLPPRQKEIYDLCNIKGYKQKEVADRLNISPQTVKAHLRDALRSIRAYFDIHTVSIIIGLVFLQ